MKRLFLVPVLILFSTKSIAQEELAPPVEIFCITEGLPSSPIMTFTMTAQSQCWGHTRENHLFPDPNDFYLTNDYDYGVYTPPGNNLGINSAGFEFISHTPPTSEYPIFAYGLYKFSNNLNNKYFYLDYRDYRAGYYSIYPPNDSSYLNSIDIWIMYNHNSNKFRYSVVSGSSNYIDIQNAQLLNIWDLKQKGTQLTSCFPEYWAHALAAINDGNDHPKLVWGPYPFPENLAGNIVGYRIYRSANHPPGQPGNFSLLTTINDPDVFDYTDNSATIGNDYDANSYYVKTIYSPDQRSIYETSATNTVEVQLQIPQKIQSDNNLKEMGFYLGQNFPNPFNPSTRISYTIPENSQVTLKVYDILGNVVAELVNERKEAGNYSVSFNASNLSSGLYFYTLRANNYSVTKKMILAK